MKRLDELNKLLKFAKTSVGVKTRLIDSMKSTFGSYKATKKNFKKSIDALPKGDRRKKGGNILSKKLFLDTFQFSGQSSSVNRLRKLAAKNMQKDFNYQKLGYDIKRIKKERKKHGLAAMKIQNEISRIKFIRKNGRIIPIRSKRKK